MRQLLLVIFVLLTSLVALSTAQADPLCQSLGYCVYESPGFKITVVDKETGQPLAGVHALAEWVQHALYGTNGPLMVQDAVSSPDGVLIFPAWGPIQGSTSGLVLNQDPVITLFTPGYTAMVIHNARGTDEKDRVHGFFQDGQIFKMEPFQRSPEEWLEQLKQVGVGRAARIADEQRLQFRDPYLNRLRRISAERYKLPERFQSPGEFFWLVDGLVKFLEEGRW